MPATELEIKPYRDDHRQQLLTVWERSVLATHHFLLHSDFTAIRQLVHSINFHQLQVFCLMKADQVLGFIGVAEHKIEMLFLDPGFRRQGLGKMLVQFAIDTLGASKLDVNAQNEQAIQFYQKAGFEVYEQTEKDDQGRNYPLLRMHRRAADDFST